MTTTLFNLQSVNLGDQELLIEFYAGDIFDVYSNIMVLSAFKEDFMPVPGTTWGTLYESLGIDVYTLPDTAIHRVSDNILEFSVKPNPCFSRLVALEMISFVHKRNFSLGTLKSRYRELGDFLSKITDKHTESLSLPLLGTGNQQISHTDSISELLDMVTHLKGTGLKIIRIFANSYQAIGSLNLKINQIYGREEATSSQLLEAATAELTALAKQTLSDLSAQTVDRLISLSKYKYSSFNTHGIAGRNYAELVTSEFCDWFNKGIKPVNLNLRLQSLMHPLLNAQPYVYSYLRLLQMYGNQAAHPHNHSLIHQDAAAIIIAIVRIIDFYEANLHKYPPRA